MEALSLGQFFPHKKILQKRIHPPLQLMLPDLIASFYLNLLMKNKIGKLNSSKILHKKEETSQGTTKKEERTTIDERRNPFIQPSYSVWLKQE
jgi:hypothetical protein